jgi:threonine-phosphate decarboxylase
MTLSKGKLEEDMNVFAKEHFGDRPFFGCLYGSYPSGTATDDSDLDLFFATPDVTPEDIQAVTRFVAQYHDENHLTHDEDVPYENKLVVSYDDIGQAIQLKGLAEEDGKTIVPPIVKEEAFLASLEVRYRLLFNALTSPHSFFGEDLLSYEDFRTIAEDQLRRVALGLLGPDSKVTIESLVESLLKGQKGEEGEMFLGYKRNKASIEHVTGIIRGQLELLDFAQNLNSLGLPEGTIEVLHDSVQNCLKYPEAYSQDDLKKILEENLGIDRSTVTFGAGTTEIMYSLPRILNEGRVLIPSPTFWAYKASNMREKKDIKRLHLDPESDFQVDYDKLEEEICEAGVVYLCNPNSPTSKLYDTEILKKLATDHPEVDFIIDETYLFFLQEFQERSLMTFAASVENVYVIASLSKFYSAPGLRAGVLVSSTDNIKKYEESMVPYTLSPISIPAVEHILKDKEFVDSARQVFTDRIRQTYELAMDMLPQDAVKVIKPEGPLMLIGLKKGLSSIEIESQLRERGLLVRDCSQIDDLGESWIRVSCKSLDEMLKLFINLSDIICK